MFKQSAQARSNHGKHIVRQTLLAQAIMTGLLGPALVLAQTLSTAQAVEAQERRVSLSLPTQSLDQSLTAFADQAGLRLEEGLVDLLAEPEVVAVGEAGLDYHYDHSPRPVQREIFAAQIALAHEHELALVVHTREAWHDTFELLAVEGAPPRWA